MQNTLSPDIMGHACYRGGGSADFSSESSSSQDAPQWLRPWRWKSSGVWRRCRSCPRAVPSQEPEDESQRRAGRNGRSIGFGFLSFFPPYIRGSAPQCPPQSAMGRWDARRGVWAFGVGYGQLTIVWASIRPNAMAGEAGGAMVSRIVLKSSWFPRQDRRLNLSRWIPYYYGEFKSEYGF